jgi:SSS family solute:Na+ symporter
MTLADYAVIGVYFLAVLALGVMARRTVRSSDDFFLSGRTLPLWITGLAFMSANLGSFELMGFAATAAKYGTFTAQLCWLGSVPAMVFSGLVMVRLFYASGVRSVPEFLFQQFGEKCRAFNAITFAVLTILTSGLSLYGLALVLQAIWGWPLNWSIWISACTVLLYVASGGLRASIYTEVLQFFMMVAGILPLSVMLLSRLGGLSGLLGQLPDHLRYVWKPVLEPSSSAYGEGPASIFIALMIASCAYWSTDFLVVQRAMAAKDIDTAAKTPILAAFPKMLFPVLTVVPGLAALVLIPEQLKTNYNMALPLMFSQFYPPGLLGLGVVALLSSFMAGMAGNVTAFNTVWTYDIYKNYVAPSRPDEHYLRVGRLVTAAGILISVATAYSARSFPSLFDYWALLSGIFVGAPFGTFLLGAFTRGIPDTAAFAGMAVGVVTSIAHYYGYRWGLIHYGSGLAMDFWGAAFGVFANIGVAAALTRSRGGRIRLRPGPFPRGTASGWRRPEVLAAAALALMVALNSWFH